MPTPSVAPIRGPEASDIEPRVDPPLAQEASYLAASARISSLRRTSIERSRLWGGRFEPTSKLVCECAVFVRMYKMTRAASAMQRRLASHHSRSGQAWSPARKAETRHRVAGRALDAVHRAVCAGERRTCQPRCCSAPGHRLGRSSTGAPSRSASPLRGRRSERSPSPLRSGSRSPEQRSGTRSLPGNRSPPGRRLPRGNPWLPVRLWWGSRCCCLRTRR